jgi:hypothetical protein
MAPDALTVGALLSICLVPVPIIIDIAASDFAIG